FIGRIDHQVKIRGFRIELGEIESVLSRQPGIKTAVVLVQGDEQELKRLVAYLVFDHDQSVSVDVIRNALQAELPAYMVPSAFMELDELPLTPNGKLDRDALPPLDVDQIASAEYLAPSGELETRIAAIWRDLLGMEKVGARDNFFDLGGHSLLMSQVQARLNEEFDRKIAMLDLFQYPTIETLSRHLRGEGEQTSAIEKARTRIGKANVDVAREKEDAIAIIGMAGRFPGAASVEQFWENLANGVESIRFFTDAELAVAGIPDQQISDPRFVAAKGYLDDAELFDAAFFGFPPREAELIDPQQRIFLECAWEALERAGYDPARYPGLIGVYAGSSANGYDRNLYSHPEIVQASGGLQIFISSNKDFLPTRISYKLNLRGPSVNVQTACSTSLVAIHEACKSLREQECDLALAGGISVMSSRVEGYLYQDESILSPDGHCRAFSADAKGTVSGEGVGIVVLKRLSEAKRDGDLIQAVIRGTAINNDGSNKVGYTAPSVEGQADVIALAQAAAGVTAESIDYIETHGTGTTLGDPIEIAALNRVFGDNRDDGSQRCAIGAVKTNFGHLDAAAGVAGVIKTALALKHGQIPPSLNYREPNPEIDFESSPFYVNTELKAWEARPENPRRAGVSSFGIGGTNAHAVLEQAPPVEKSEPGREWQLFPISAKNEAALEQSKNRIADYLDRNPDASLADVSYTLRTGRGQFEYRAAAIGEDNASAVAALRGERAGRLWANHDVTDSPAVIFMFPGQGSQHARMGQDLYETETVFREIVDDCCEQLKGHIDVDLRDIIFARQQGGLDQVDEQLRQTLMAQCSLFVIEYALARLWLSWGIRPAAMIGHSIGEYVAACIAGVIDLDVALSLIAIRGQAMARAPAGAMLSVPLPEQRVIPYLGDDLWLSVINGHAACVVSGTPGAIDGLEQRLQSDGVDALRLHTSGAFHSGLMDDVVPELVRAASKLKISPSEIPYISNVTGTWIEASQLEEPEYWGRHLRQTVRFAEGVDVLLEKYQAGVFLEVGPGKTLGSILRQGAADANTEVEILASLRHPREILTDGETVVGALAGLWLRGVDIDWQGYDQHGRRCRVELPTYPFQRQSYWVELATEAEAGRVTMSRLPMDKWFYIPLWKSSMPLKPKTTGSIEGQWLVLCDDAGISADIIQWLRAHECE
ncbi:MAG: acyltransferase domain-containing protein, partial [Gammaproteobacteria bacterium]|nr:acyltransferase domain-containing protein [Gammaproteobacteria bacterium]